jgi:hypothetical protein
MFSTFVPSLLMQTTNRLKTEPYSPYNILCPQPENYRNWLMLQEIVRNNVLFKQLKSTDTDDSEQENEDDEDSSDIPLDLSIKIDTDQTSTNKQSSIKSTKSILSPLNEQDITKYRYINTTELVQTVKDLLSRYSISQRHFGEKILGLSQGSVSDILARPKQWELLIKQLLQTVSLTSSPSVLNGFHSNNLISNENSIDSQSNDCSQVLVAERLSSSNGTTTTTNNNNNKSKSRSKNNKDQSRQQTTTKSQMPPYELPKITLPSKILFPLSFFGFIIIIYLAAMDTEQLSSQVRELLSSYSIGQRVFGME